MGNFSLAFALNAVFYLVVFAACLILGALTLNNLPMGMTPGFSARLKHYATHNLAKTEANARFPELELPVIRTNPRELLTRIERAMETLGWQVNLFDSDTLTIEAVVTTALFRFKDDISVSLVRRGQLVEVHITSQSRVGKGDLGANARHILDLLAMIDKQIDIEVPSY